MNSIARISLLFIALTAGFCEEIQTPIAKMKVSLPENFDVYELDLGKQMGKCDLISDSEQNFMFTILKFDVEINEDLLAGLTNGIEKQGGNNNRIEITGYNGVKMTAIKSILPSETRIYIPYPKSKIVVLAQIAGKYPENTLQFKAVISALR